MDKNIDSQCVEICEKLSNNLAHFEEMFSVSNQLKTKSLDTEVELYSQALNQRQNLINEIEQENQEIDSLQNEIARTIGFEDFKLELLQPYLLKDRYENLFSLYDSIQNVIQKTLDLDQEYGRNVELEKNATALQLHRLHSIIRSRRSYLPAYNNGARFIDKMK